MNQQNKDLYSQIAYNLIADGSTNLQDSIIGAMSQLIERKEKNDLTSIFFLSDGEDTTGH